MKFIISPWENEFIDIIKNVKEELFISSPFIDSTGIEIISNKIDAPEEIKISIITNLTLENIRNKGINPISLVKLWDKFRVVEISSLGRLHAKVYIIDNEKAVITSANLTGGGLINNFEYGVLLENKDDIKGIKEDMKKYFYLGNIFLKEILEKISMETQKLWNLQTAIEKEIEKQNKNEFNKILYNLETELLKNRIREKKTINSIFADTILYLLKKKGPLTTDELHPLIQTIHPDICNDSIDRVINGQHFGKKWKHLVRSAQQFLKRKGLIELKNKKWHLLRE